MRSNQAPGMLNSPCRSRKRPMRCAMVWARWVTSVFVGAFTQRKRTDLSGRSTYTSSRNSMWRWILRFSADTNRWISVTAPACATLQVKPAFFNQVGSDDAIYNAQHLAHDRRAASEQETQRIRNAQHPLSYRLLWEDLVHQQCGALGHAPSATAGTEAASFASSIQQTIE